MTKEPHDSSFRASTIPGVPETERQRETGEKKVSKEYYGRKAKAGALWSVVRQGGHEIVAIPTSMIMARLLSPSDFGIAAAAAFFILLATRLTQFGFNAALVRIKVLRPDHASSVFAVNLAMGLATYLALSFSAPLIGRFLRSAEAGSLLPVAGLIFLITPLGTVPAALIARQMQFRYATVTDWLDSVVGAVISVLLALWGFAYWSIVYGQLSGALLRVLSNLYLSGWTLSLRCSRAALRELLAFGLGLQAKRLLEFAAFNLDNLVVGRVLGMTALGFYDKAFTTMNRLVNRLTLGQAYFRIFAIIHEEPERFRRAYSKLMLTISLIGLPMFAGCIVVARSLFLVLYGEKWLPAVIPFQLLCAGGMLKLLNAYASQANEAVGNVWPQARRQAIGAVLVVVGAWAGSRYGGIEGAALGVGIALTILTASMLALVRRATGLTWRAMLAPLVPAALCSTILVFVLLGVERGIEALIAQPAPLQVLVPQAIVGSLFYVGLVIFSPFASVRDIVSETIDDTLPPKVVRLLSWYTRPVQPRP